MKIPFKLVSLTLITTLFFACSSTDSDGDDTTTTDDTIDPNPNFELNDLTLLSGWPDSEDVFMMQVEAGSNTVSTVNLTSTYNIDHSFAYAPEENGRVTWHKKFTIDGPAFYHDINQQTFTEIPFGCNLIEETVLRVDSDPNSLVIGTVFYEPFPSVRIWIQNGTDDCVFAEILDSQLTDLFLDGSYVYAITRYQKTTNQLVKIDRSNGAVVEVIDLPYSNLRYIHDASIFYILYDNQLIQYNLESMELIATIPFEFQFSVTPVGFLDATINGDFLILKPNAFGLSGNQRGILIANKNTGELIKQTDSQYLLTTRDELTDMFAPDIINFNVSSTEYDPSDDTIIITTEEPGGGYLLAHLDFEGHVLHVMPLPMPAEKIYLRE